MRYHHDGTGVQAARVLAVCVAAAAAAAAGCVAPPAEPEPEPEPETIATSQLTSLPPRDGVPQVCTQNRYCSFKPATGSEADTSHYALWGRLGCGPIYNFENGPDFGLGALCVDSAANRAMLHNSSMSGLVPTFGCVEPPTISPCLNLPVGVIFVDLDPKIPEPQPFCPSTCRDTPSMVAF
jgi:hypothetical protein